LRAVVEPADRADPAVRAAAREVYGAAAKGTASDSYRLAVTHMANACGMTS
jgi:hypothetical protein